MKRTWCGAIVLFFVLGSAAGADGPSGADDIQTVLNAQVKGFPGVGVVVGLIDHGRTTVYMAGSTGTARPLDEHTLFEIGSITKTLTATLLASMVLDGSVALDDPIAKYLPASVHVPERDGKQITLLNLATQRSGLPRLPTNFNPRDQDDPYADYSLKNLYAFLNTYTLPRVPGASYEYSNLGVGLLGDVLAARAKQDYFQLLRTRVLAPLHMTETAITLTPGLRDRFAAGHDADGDPAKAWNLRAIAPAGGLRASLADMLKYLRCEMGNGPIAQACLFAQQQRDTIAPNSFNIGLVWQIFYDDGNIFHAGRTGGFNTFIAITKDHSKGVVVLSNGDMPAGAIAFHVLTGQSVAHQPLASTPDQATLDSYVGTYTASTGAPNFTITRDGEKLRGGLTGQTAYRLLPLASDQFFSRVADTYIDFKRGSGGAVSGLVVVKKGANIVALRDGIAAPSPAELRAIYPPIITFDEAAADEYAGKYRFADGREYLVTHEGQKIVAQRSGEQALQMFPVSKDHFIYLEFDRTIEFERDNSGHIVRLVIHWPWGVESGLRE